VYSRVIDDEVVTFDTSGGLLNASLVMIDHESTSYWSIMSGRAIWGRHRGRPLQVVPGADKTTYGDWRDRHPHTRVLSVDGNEHATLSQRYDRYFASPEGFRSMSSGDDRLVDKDLLYGLHEAGTSWAVPHTRIGGGAVVAIGEKRLFLWRRPGDSPFQGSAAWWLAAADTLQPQGKSWLLRRGADNYRFDVSNRAFPEALDLRPATGFDTYWYVWSLTNPDTRVIAR
jgi:hypothetical protein|tara:strand:+ start:81 stop:764 length:684 start_codon:yes stop_codon:yes gene_type:complete